MKQTTKADLLMVIGIIVLIIGIPADGTKYMPIFGITSLILVILGFFMRLKSIIKE